MDFADEHYIKFFTRDTVTWNRWPWQARCVLGPLMRKLTKAGVADVDARFGVAESIAALITVPADVVAPALDAYLADGTLELHGSKLVMPKFLEAQESRKTKQVIAHDYRQKQRDVARAKSAGLLTPPVTIRDQTGHDETSRDPPAQPSPSPAQPDPVKDPPRKQRASAPKPPADVKAPDPRHAPLVKALVDRFEQGGSKYPFTGRDAKAVTQLLAIDMPPTIVAAWDRALRSTGYPLVRTLPELVTHFAHFVGTGPPGRGAERAPDPSTAGEGTITAKELQL